MKYYKRYLSAFVVFVLLFATFFTTSVSAETVNNLTGKFNLQWKTDDVFVEDIATVSDVADGDNISVGNSYFDSKAITYNTQFMNLITLKNSDDSVIIKQGQTITLTMDNAKFLIKPSNSVNWVDKISKLTYYVRYADGTYSSQIDITDAFNYYAGTQTFGYNFKFTAYKDIKTIFIREYFKPYDFGINGVQSTLVLNYVSDSIRFYYDVEPKEVGLLDGILGWVKNIFNMVEDSWKVMSSGFANIGTWFSELPGKLWAVISDGLKNLFVPDEEYMTDYSDKWDNLLSQRFGALYQVGDLITDFAGSIQNSDKTNTIYLPQVSLNNVGIPFSFGGYDIQIVPAGFDTVVEICKKIISIVCTFLFLNGLRKKYDSVMGVQQ